MTNIIKKVVIGALAMCGAFALYGETISLTSGSVSYDGAEAVKIGDEVVLTFTEGGSFSISKNAKARILAIGGGGAGGAMAETAERGAAGGGGAGGMIDRSQILEPGVYTVEVGQGGQKVQTVVQSWTGDGGKPSYIDFNNQHIVLAKGGGGGGSVKVNGRGTDGGSGGGGAWYGNFLNAGQGTDGQGWAGGKPEDEAIGGGGGGAAATAAEGRGKADGTPGAGRVSDITGSNVTYAKGGRGGNRNNSAYSPAAGVGYGDGGDGAVIGLNGAGADGVVIVRIKELFNYQLVEIPEDIEKKTWENNKTFTVFTLASSPIKDAIDRVEGDTSFKCTLDGETHLGLGQHHFVIYLKEGYKWDDGNGGSTEPLVCYWYIADPGNTKVASIKAKKTVSWSEGKNAVITLEAEAVPEEAKHIPNVLFLGSLCSAHGFKANIMTTALKAITRVANVDYFLYNKVTSKSASSNTNKYGYSPYQSGSFEAGVDEASIPTSFRARNPNGNNSAKDADCSLDSAEGNHGTLYGFYQKIHELQENEQIKKYDYIVLSFDRTKVATTFPGQHPNEGEVAAYMKTMYDKNAVIWLVDSETATVNAQYSYTRQETVTVHCTQKGKHYHNGKSYNGSHDMQQTQSVTENVTDIQTPWAANQLVYLDYGDGNSQNKWTTLDGYYAISSITDETPKADYVAMMGMFSPADYANAASLYDNNHFTTFDANSQTKLENTTGQANANQCVYSQAKAVEELIESVVVTVPMNLTLVDKIAVDFDKSGVNHGLSITGITAEWGTNDVVYTAKPEEITVDDAEGKITVNVGPVVDPAWLKVNIGVEDNGGFLSSKDAKFNEVTGQWEKDPNNGPVETSLIPEGGTQIIVETKASTAVQWSFTSHMITGAIEYGQGEFIINGFETNEYHVAEGYSPEVVFRGKAGYVLDKLVIDGEEVAFDKTTYNHIFEEIGFDHDVKVGFVSVLTLQPEPVVSPVTVPYDGQAHGCLVTPPTFVEGYSFEWVPLYSLSEDGPFSPNLGAIDVGTTEVYVRYGILGQLGYAPGEYAEMPDWTGHAAVTVTPQPITIKVCDQVEGANSGHISKNEFSYRIVSGGTLGTQVEQLTYKVGNGSGNTDQFPTEGGATAPITATVRIMDGNTDVTSNYAITVIDGTYTKVGERKCAAKADDYVGEYDGKEHTIDFAVVNPNGAVDGRQHTVTDNVGSALPTQDSAAPNFTTVVILDQNGKVKTINNLQTDTSFNNGPCYTDLQRHDQETLISETMTEKYSVLFSIDGGNTWVSELPEFTDAGTYTIDYKVQYAEVTEKVYDHKWWVTGTYHYQTTETYYEWFQKKTRKVNNAITSIVQWPPEGYTGVTDQHKTDYKYSDNVIRVSTNEYTEATGKAQVIITPRGVTITADSASAEKYIYGNTVTADGYKVTSGSFVDGEGIQSLSMKDTSTITNPGTIANEIDPASLVFNGNTNNYVFTYVPGTLTVGENPLKTSATAPEKTYDGAESEDVAITLVDDNGNPLPQGSYTIKYAANPWDEFTTTAPQPPTDAGEYAYWYVVEGGGYGTVTNFTTITVRPRTITVTADTEEKFYNGEPLTANATWTQDFVDGEGIAKVIMTDDSTITYPGKTKNKVAEVQFTSGTKAQNYNIVKVDGLLTVKRTLEFDVTDDGEFSWDMNLAGGTGPGNVIVIVDGKTNTIFKTAEGHYAVHVAEPIDGNETNPPTMDTCEDHKIVFVFTDDDDKMFPDNVTWIPAADEEQLRFTVVNLDPPDTNVEDFKKEITIYNDPYSGWLPVYDIDDEGNKVITGIRTSDGSENGINGSGDQHLDSNFQLVVAGTGEIKFGTIIIPVRDDLDLNPDGGALTITVDGVDYTIPPLVDLDDRCTVETNDGIIVIHDLVLKVNGKIDEAHPEKSLYSDSDHFVTITYIRDASDPTSNSAAIIENISWKTYGETDDGGTSWIQDKEVWIIDHEDKVEEGYVYLCFRPELKVEEEVVEWVNRSSDHDKIMVKFGATQDDMEKCTPVIAKLSDRHEVLPIQVWVKVPTTNVVTTAAYWKIYIDGSNGSETVQPGGPASDGDAAESINTFGILEVESSQQNTMISIPWTDYSRSVDTAADIPVEKLVKPEGLENGDMIYAYDSDDTYAVWMLQDKKWLPQKVWKVDAKGNQSMNYIAGKENARAARGGGLWVVRQHPTDEKGNPKKIMIYGQRTVSDVSSAISGQENDRPGTTMMGNPTTQAIDINSLEWGSNPTDADFITIPDNEGGTPIKLTWYNGAWGYSVSKVNSRGRLTLSRVTGYEIKPGAAFWYTRNGGAFNVKWPKLK